MHHQCPGCHIWFSCVGSVSQIFQPQTSGPLHPDGNTPAKAPQFVTIAPSSSFPASNNSFRNIPQNVVSILDPKGRRILMKSYSRPVANFSEKVSNDSDGSNNTGSFQKSLSILDAPGKLMGISASNDIRNSDVNNSCLKSEHTILDELVTPNVSYSNQVEILNTSDNAGRIVKKENALPKRHVGQQRLGLSNTVSSKDLQNILERSVQNDPPDDIQVEIGFKDNVTKAKQDNTPRKRERKRPFNEESDRIPKYKKQKRSALYRLEPGVSSSEYLEKMRCPYDINFIVTPSGHRFPFPLKYPGPNGKGRYKCPVNQCPFEFPTPHIRHLVENHLERHAKVCICKTPGMYTL